MNLDKSKWGAEDFARYFRLMDQLVIEVVKGSPLLDMPDKTAIGSHLSRIAYGVIQAEFARDEDPPAAPVPFRGGSRRRA